MNWPYFTFKASNTATTEGYLYDDNGHRVKFDGAARTYAAWEEYLINADIRGSVY